MRKVYLRSPLLALCSNVKYGECFGENNEGGKKAQFTVE